MPYKEYNSKMNDYMKRRYFEKRAKALAYLGGQCVECGEVDELVFDHIDPETKEYAVGKIICHRWEKVRAELDKCQLLCKSCNATKTSQDLADIVRRNGWSNQHGSGPMIR